MKRKYLFLILVMVISYMQFQNLYGEDKMSEENNPYSQWFVWKYENVSDPEQKKVIAYFKKIDNLLKKAEATQYKTKESLWGDPDPKRAYKIVTQSIEGATKISPPLLCRKHYNSSLQILRSIADYQKRRIDLGDAKIIAKRKEDQLFEEKLRGDQLEQFKLQAETSREFYAILRKIGFYDNATKEMSDLKLITPEEKAELERLNKENKKSK